MPEINFAGVGDQQEWKPAPTGDYILELVDTEDDKIKSGPNQGQPKTTLQWEIVDMEGDLEQYNGRRIYDNITYSEKALPRIKNMLQAFGAKVDDSEGAEDLSWEWEDLLGHKLRAKISSVGETRNSETGQKYPAKNKVTRFLVPDLDDSKE